TSCGWGVPVMDFDHHRETLVKYHAQSDPVEWAYKHRNRRESIDGLPTRQTDRYIAGTMPTPAK
ncbi:MAG: pyridoxamine 5'-phosphate oxidase family protein, partial [Erythrobacter sp.]|nr:pyridoxamine 5'-phosphate oxidase family protein [Erythrobacter sp.]